MTSGLLASIERLSAEEHAAFCAQRWQAEPNAADRLRRQAVAYLSRLAVPSERLNKYRACWDAATASDGQAPLPCPQCFSKWILSPLKVLGTTLEISPLGCAKCGSAFTLTGTKTINA